MTTLSFKKVVIGVLGAYGIDAAIIEIVDETALRPIRFRA